MRHPTDFAQAILNSVSAHIAVMAPSGQIIATNEAWRAFARRNGDPAESVVGVGANYLAACRAAEAGGDASAALARSGIESVLHGHTASFVYEYPCHAPTQQRWFSMSVSPMPAAGGVVLAHEDITARKLAEDSLRLSHDLLEQRVLQRTSELEQSLQRLRQAAKVFDSAVEAIVIIDAGHRIVTVNRAFSTITGYGADEVLGRNPSLYASGRHGREFNDELWRSLATSGHWQGEIWHRRKNGEAFPAWESVSVTRDADDRIVEYVSVFSDISEVKHAEDRLAYLAHHDPLTGLANRLLFGARLDQAVERARRHQTKLALLFIDMDNFKLINDSLGHLVGDQYLKTMGERLIASVRAEDTVARLGGDEFAVLAEDVDDAQSAGRLADKIVHVLAEGVPTASHDVASSASIGIGLFPDDADSGEALLKAADAAMYQAKGDGRNTARFYRPEMSARALKRLALEGSLRHAIARQELVLHYQPLVDLATRRCVGVEALLRWNSPEHGFLMPEAFISLAEDTRLIQPIGNWVIRQALHDLRGWRAQGLAPLRLAVNVSWRQFNEERFVDELLVTLDEHGLQARDVQLDVEVTESALQNSTRAVQDLHRLHQVGVHVMIDDFGTGHSSLSQLMHMPVDGLKIDRMFLRDAMTDPHSRAIIRAVLALAHGLGLEVIAEGVETEAQASLLRAEGCSHAQGFLFGAAVPAAQLPELVRSIRAADCANLPA